MQSDAYLEAFLIKQGMPFLHVSNVLGVCRGIRSNHMPHMQKPAQPLDISQNCVRSLPQKKINRY